MKKFIVITFIIFPCFLLNGQVLHDDTSNQNEVLAIDVKQAKLIDSLFQCSTRSFAFLKQQYDSVIFQCDSVIAEIRIKGRIVNRLEIGINGYIEKIDSVAKIKQERLQAIGQEIEQLKSETLAWFDKLDISPDLKSKIITFTFGADNLDLSQLMADQQFSRLEITSKISLQIPVVNRQLEGLSGESIPNMSLSTDIPLIDQPRVIISTGINTKTNSDHLFKVAEEQMAQINGLRDVKEELNGVPQTPFTSEEATRSKLLQKTTEVAIDHFAGMEEQLKESMATISKYKKKYASVNSLQDIAKKSLNVMKGKPLIERIVPGFGIQVQKKNDDVMLDFNPYVTYRHTDRISSGIGWNQRFAYNTDKTRFTHRARIYGPRIFGEYKISEGLYSRAEFEVMNTKVPPFTRRVHNDPQDRQWVPGVFVGVKKDYRFLKKLKGNASVMVRVFNPQHKSPYADIINARVGFEFPMKKKAVN